MARRLSSVDAHASFLQASFREEPISSHCVFSRRENRMKLKIVIAAMAVLGGAALISGSASGMPIAPLSTQASNVEDVALVCGRHGCVRTGPVYRRHYWHRHYYGHHGYHRHWHRGHRW
jgi:hypothetical protein